MRNRTARRAPSPHPPRTTPVPEGECPSTPVDHSVCVRRELVRVPRGGSTTHAAQSTLTSPGPAMPFRGSCAPSLGTMFPPHGPYTLPPGPALLPPGPELHLSQEPTRLYPAAPVGVPSQLPTVRRLFLSLTLWHWQTRNWSFLIHQTFEPIPVLVQY